MLTRISTKSGNVYWLYPDNYIRGEQLRKYNPYEDEESVQVDGFLHNPPVVGDCMNILRGPSGRSWQTSAVVSVEPGVSRVAA